MIPGRFDMRYGLLLVLLLSCVSRGQAAGGVAFREDFER